MTNIRRKKLNYNNRSWILNVSTYDNNRLCISMESRNSIKEISINLNDAYLNKDHIFLDPEIVNSNLYKVLKKEKIITTIDGTYSYDYQLIPVAIYNLNALKKYDNKGVNKYIKLINEEIVDDTK